MGWCYVTGSGGGAPEVWIEPGLATHLRREYGEVGAEDPAEVEPTGEALAVAREAWEALVDAERSRRQAAEAEVDRLRAEVRQAQEAARRAQEAAQEGDRGRLAAEARLEALRAEWWHFWAGLGQMGLRDRVRRRWPEPPADLAGGRRLSG